MLRDIRYDFVTLRDIQYRDTEFLRGRIQSLDLLLFIQGQLTGCVAVRDNVFT
jgi:hypothetical protein